MLTLILKAFHSKYWRLFKWSLMTAAIFWLVVSRLAEQGSKIPEFIYVNF